MANLYAAIMRIEDFDENLFLKMKDSGALENTKKHTCYASHWYTATLDGIPISTKINHNYKGAENDQEQQ
jgi:hypothetical protein